MWAEIVLILLVQQPAGKEHEAGVVVAAVAESAVGEPSKPVVGAV